jgi:tRNA G37 N-methylase Trm5
LTTLKKISLLPGQQILQKKGRGRIIHVSGFIDAVDGRLALRDEEGKVVEEARKIIYPGANGSDAWWDTAQLLAQMKDVIHIFEAAHPNHQALFIFDQSSAHASLPEDAL